MEASDGPISEPRFGYFLLQARAAIAPAEPGISLVVEDLGTGEKHRFETPDGISAFLANWAKPFSTRSQP